MNALRHDQSDFNVLFIHSALDEAGLTVHAFRIYCHLARRAGKDGAAYPGAESMAALCRMKRDTVFAALRELEGRGMLERRKRHGSSNEYWLTKASQWRQISPVPNEGTSPETGLHPSPQTGLHPSPQTGRKGIPSEGNPRKGNPEALPAASQGRICDSAFEMLVKVQGSKLDGMTPSERGAINKALRDIKETAPPSTTSEQMAAEIKKRAVAYSEKFSEGTIFTATALAKYWSQLGEWRPAGAALASPQEAPVTPCPTPDWKTFANTTIGWSIPPDSPLRWEDLTHGQRSEFQRNWDSERRRLSRSCPLGGWQLFAREVIGWTVPDADSIKWEDLPAGGRQEWLRHFELDWRRAWTTLFDFAPPPSWWAVLDMHKPQLLEQIFKREGDGPGTAA
jgi:hypothetical protein